ncbi:hypothetical protein QQG74_28235 [Micromonospora sp. FIMYZ51]|uniref:hypothetical protein n=1 Tax=Micromonospora sp. FIMYZ51 TaxID=3051832 RepID=UPI00311F5BFA
MSKQTTRGSLSAKPLDVTGGETRAELIKRAKRSAVPLRRAFVQLAQDKPMRHGVLASFVQKGDLRALRAYLMVLAASSGQDERGKTTELDSLVWGRLFDADQYTADDAGTRTAAWRTLIRLQKKQLISCARTPGSRKIKVTLLREDGSGQPYTRPGLNNNDAYLQIPTAFWLRGFDGKVSMPGLAMLLAICNERNWAAFPAERMPEDRWYGWSADTTERGLKELLKLGLIERRERYKRAPLTPAGSTMFYQYRPTRVMRAASKPRAAAAATE